MADRIVIDPITRIEGHLRIEVEVRDGRVVDAYSSGTMVRGFELHPQGTRPARRLGVHRARLRRLHHGARAGVRAHRRGRAGHHGAAQCRADPQPDVLRAVPAGPRRALLPPARARLGGRGAALKADPQKTSELAQSISSWPKSSPKYFADLQKRLTTFVESGQLGIFANGYWGHPAYKLPPEVNLMGVAHYLEALEWQKEIVKVHTIFGGKNPHPNYLVGGAPCSINLDEANAINAERLALVGQAVRRGARRSSSRSTFPTCWRWRPSTRTGGRSAAACRTTSPTATCRPTATATRRASSSRAVPSSDATSPRCCRGRRQGRRPGAGVHQPLLVRLLGRRRRREAPVGGRDDVQLHRPEAAVRAARRRAEVQLAEDAALEGTSDGGRAAGAAARRLRRPAIRRSRRWSTAVLAALDVPVEALFSTLGRTAARGLETKLIARWAREFYDQLLANIKNGDTRMADHSKWDPSDLAGRGAGRRPDRSAARRARPLDRHQGRQDRQLPARGAEHLERVAARRAGAAVGLRGVAHRHAGRQPGAAARGPAHDPLVRSLHRLRRAPARRAGPIRAPPRYVLRRPHVARHRD